MTNGGTTISVPQESVYEERVLLAGDGVVKGGGSGYELFDKMNFGMTDFQEKIAKQRATEGELQRTIAGLTPVESARVHIASPEASLYSSVQQPTTASVAIKTKPGMSLGPTEVRGITQLVVTGVTTEVCVNTTVREANDRGYDCLVPSDCVGSYFPEFQEMGLKMIKAQGGIFGWVTNSGEILKAIGG